MRRQLALLAVCAAAVAACRSRQAEVPCMPDDGMPVIQPDTGGYSMPRVAPSDLHDSAMATRIVRAPCPDGTE